MEALHDSIDKLLAEADHLGDLMDTDDVDHVRLSIALGVAKRVRRHATIVLRGIAKERDQLQAEEAKST